MKILVVEEQDILKKLIERLAIKYDFFPNIIAYRTIDELEDAVNHRETSDLIIITVSISARDGLIFNRKLRDAHCSSPLLIMTEYTCYSVLDHKVIPLEDVTLPMDFENLEKLLLPFLVSL